MNSAFVSVGDPVDTDIHMPTIGMPFLDTMAQVMGYSNFGVYLNEFSDAIFSMEEMVKDMRADARRRQIKKFNKRKKQRRAYCGGRK